MPCLEIVPFGWFLVWLLHSFFSIKCGEKLKEIHVCQHVLLPWCHEMPFLQLFHLLENYYFLWITSFCVQCLCHLMWASSAICQCDEIGRFLTFIIMMTMTTKYFPARWFCNFFFCQMLWFVVCFVGNTWIAPCFEVGTNTVWSIKCLNDGPSSRKPKLLIVINKTNTCYWQNHLCHKQRSRYDSD